MSRIFLIFFLLLIVTIIAVSDLNKFKSASIDTLFTKKIEKIKILNLNNISEQYILNFLNIEKKKSFWNFNPKELKKKLGKINEIESFEFYLTPSGILEISIKENSPFMIWNNNGKINYIDKDGKILNFNYFSPLDLIYLYGNDANKKISELNAVLEKYDLMKSKLKKIFHIPGVSWNLFLDDQKCIQIPTKNIEKILKIHEKVKQSEVYKQYKKIDMTINGRIYFSNNKCLI